MALTGHLDPLKTSPTPLRPPSLAAFFSHACDVEQEVPVTTRWFQSSFFTRFDRPLTVLTIAIAGQEKGEEVLCEFLTEGISVT